MKYEIMENTEAAKDEFHERGWGTDTIDLTREEAEKLCKALLSGKCIGFDDGEYTHVMYIKDEQEK